MALPEILEGKLRLPLIGAFPALNARPQELLGEWLTRIEEDLVLRLESEYRAAQERLL